MSASRSPARFAAVFAAALAATGCTIGTASPTRLDASSAAQGDAGLGESDAASSANDAGANSSPHDASANTNTSDAGAITNSIDAAATTNTSDASANTSSIDAGASTGSLDAGDTLPMAGNPDGSCTTIALPAEAQAVDTSNPTSVVGSGTAASCTFAALAAAVSKGGIITFNCGDGLVTIPVTATLTPPTSNAYNHEASITTVIDGGRKITLDGGQAVQLINWTHTGSWQLNKDTLTLQHLRLINGKTTPTQVIPACPPSGGISNAECSTGYDDGEGGALYMRDGNLRVIDCIFEDNQAALLGPDTGGGALYLLGTGSPAYIVQSTFRNNTASNAGAIGLLWAGASIFNSLFEGNSAVGTGANNDDATKCTCINNGQNQTGSGGNGGAIYKDGGDGMALTVCGTRIRGNSANEFGAAIFLTADGSNAQLILDDSLLDDNPSPISYWNWCTGVSTDNPHASGSTTCSPSPVNTTFCDTSGKCTTSCGS